MTPTFFHQILKPANQIAICRLRIWLCRLPPRDLLLSGRLILGEKGRNHARACTVSVRRDWNTP